MLDWYAMQRCCMNNLCAYNQYKLGSERATTMVYHREKNDRKKIKASAWGEKQKKTLKMIQRLKQKIQTFMLAHKNKLLRISIY